MLSNLIIIDSIDYNFIRSELAITFAKIKHFGLVPQSVLHIVKVVPLAFSKKPLVYEAFEYLDTLEFDHTFPIFIVFGIIFLISTLTSLFMLSYFGLYGAFLNNIPSLLIF
jgi:hypothetical protein